MSTAQKAGTVRLGIFVVGMTVLWTSPQDPGSFLRTHPSPASQRRLRASLRRLRASQRRLTDPHSLHALIQPAHHQLLIREEQTVRIGAVVTGAGAVVGTVVAAVMTVAVVGAGAAVITGAAVAAVAIEAVVAIGDNCSRCGRRHNWSSGGSPETFDQQWYAQKKSMTC